MRNLFRDRTGFAAVETVLVVVIIAAVGGTGWYVYHTKHASDKVLTAANHDASASVPASKASSSSASSQNLQTDLDGVNSSVNQSNKDSASTDSALNDSQQEVTVPTN